MTAETPPTGPNTPSYSKAFEILAGDGKDLDGLVAYALYKKAKRAWIIEHSPSHGEICAHHKILVGAYIDALHTQAQALLNRYGEDRLSEATPDILAQGFDQQLDIISEDISRRVDSFKDETIQHLSNIHQHNKSWSTFGVSILASVMAWIVGLAVTFVILNTFGAQLIVPAPG